MRSSWICGKRMQRRSWRCIMVRHYFVDLRLHRMQDAQYWSFRIRIEADGLSALEAQLRAFEAGARLARGGRLGVDNIGIDGPITASNVAEYVGFDDPTLQHQLQLFLGIKRDRSVKKPPKTE